MQLTGPACLRSGGPRSIQPARQLILAVSCFLRCGAIMTKRRRWLAILVSLAVIAVLIVVYALTHPLVFMEAHQHCIKFAGLQLLQYADQHEGRFPFHPGGYGNALLLMDEDCFHSLTGPG